MNIQTIAVATPSPVGQGRDKKKHLSRTLCLIAGALWLAGCADGNYRPYALDDNYGKAEKHLLNAQIADPKAAKNPPAKAPNKMDGYAGANTINSYRQGFSQISQPQGLTINIGGVGGSGSGTSSK